ncbi:MAG: DUF1778 domain-containing protein [Treponema sp.]
MAVSAVKDERFDIRTNLKAKSLLEKVAELKHISLSTYILSSSIKQAQTDIEEQEKNVLNMKERDLFMNALDNPPEPTKA